LGSEPTGIGEPPVSSEGWIAADWVISDSGNDDLSPPHVLWILWGERKLIDLGNDDEIEFNHKDWQLSEM